VHWRTKIAETTRYGARKNAEKKQDMAHGKTHKKNTIWRTKKRRKKYSAREKNTKQKKTIWCTKKRRNKHDIVHEKKKKHDLVHEEINETWHGCCMKMCKDVFFSDEKMLLYIEVFLWKKKQKKHSIEAPCGARWI
jgi:hypothetical protein